MKKVDKIFKQEIDEKFSFNKEVASVFDDMLMRSIPYYKDNIILITDLLKDSKSICDIGCSTGNLLLYLAQNASFEKLVGIDNSSFMLEIARAKARAYGVNISFIEADILDFEFSSECVIANYTMQFIRPLYREELLKKIYNSLPKSGKFIMSEKLVTEDKWLDKRLIDIYHNFKKKNGYSKSEISKKREALENILVPYSQDENIKMLKNAGFKSVEVVFKFGNFASFIAIK